MNLFSYFSFLMIFTIATSNLAKSPYSNHWIYVSKNLNNPKEFSELIHLIKQASKYKYNGIVLDAGLDRLCFQPPAYFRRLQRMKFLADSLHIEIIPMIFSIGYASSLIAHNPNLAEGLPVKNAPFVISKGWARPVPDTDVKIINGDFEEVDNGRFWGYQIQDQPGEISFVDTRVARRGHQSIRFENFSLTRTGNGRLMQSIQVKPYRAYVISFWIKTENLDTENFKLQIYAGRHGLYFYKPKLPATSGWHKISYLFNSQDHTRLRIYIGVWQAKKGRFWLDNITIRPAGLTNVLRRSGTPVIVKKASTREILQENTDYAAIYDAKLSPFSPFHEHPGIRILPEANLQDGDTLLVSWYHSVLLGKYQVVACMAEPEIYSIWQEEIQKLQFYLNPKYYFLSMDEIRMGGTCEADKRTGLSLSQILAQCISRQYYLIKAVNPAAKIFIWSDMLDPNHNGHKNYFLAKGNFNGAWRYIPKDITMVCWNYKIREKSIKHFTENGFKIMAAMYYDTGNLNHDRLWIQSLQKFPRCLGSIYTTWKNDYHLLPQFIKLFKDE